MLPSRAAFLMSSAWLGVYGKENGEMQSYNG